MRAAFPTLLWVCLSSAAAPDPTLPGDDDLIPESLRWYARMLPTHAAAIQQARAYGAPQLDAARGELTYYDEKHQPVAVARVVRVGSYSHKRHLWRWAWAEAKRGRGEGAALEPVRAFGRAHGYARLTTGSFRAARSDSALAMAAAAFEMLHAKGLYRQGGEDDDLWTYYVFTDIKRAGTDWPGPPVVLPPGAIPDDGVTAREKACEAGSGDECDRLGLVYERGNYRRRDLERAVKLFERSCEDLHDVGGCHDLARMHHKGRGTRVDLRRASELYQRACDGGSVHGCDALAKMLDRREPARAAALLNKACEGKLGSACFLLGSKLMPGQPARARERFEAGCQAEDGDSCIMLSRMYLKGKGVKADPKHALELFVKGHGYCKIDDCTLDRR